MTIPSPVLPILEETPPFMRATTFASMDTPGPYETVAKEAFFNVMIPVLVDIEYFVTRNRVYPLVKDRSILFHIILQIMCISFIINFLFY